MGLQVHFENGLLRLILDASSRGNSFGGKDADVLSKALKAKRPVRGLLFESTGRLFCAGGDLGDYSRMKKSAQGKAVNRKISSALRLLSEWPHPTVALVRGDCYGGGMELLSAFDHVVATPEAMFGLWQRRIGLSFGWGGGARLEERLGRGRLKKLALTARAFSSYEALVLGLIDEIQLKSTIEARALEWLEAVSSLPSTPVRGLKTYEPRSEKKLFENLWWNDEHRAALKRRQAR